MIVKKLFLFILTAIPLFVFAQREQVNLKVRNAAAMRKFEYHQPSSFDVVNGKFSAALVSSNGYTFEISGLSAKQIKCNAVLKPTQFKAVLIDDRMGKTYASNTKSTGTLSIRCLPNGQFELLFQGEVWLDTKKVNIDATLVGAVAHSRQLKTN